MKSKILLIAPHPDVTAPLTEALESNGYSVQEKYTFLPMEREPMHDRFDLIITLFNVKKRRCLNTGKGSKIFDAFFILGNGSVSHAVQIYKNGFYTFGDCKEGTSKFIKTIDDLLNNNHHFTNRENGYKGKKSTIHHIIGKSPQIVEIRKTVSTICKYPNLPVLITGETGTGKELVADVLHHASVRADKPFIKINCSAIPETLLESQLFGHTKGAFTGATQDKIGLFEKADGGTVLLDEIGEMDRKLQPKLLRFLENQSFHRVGGTKEIHVDVWVLATTNALLPPLILKGLFRQDLYYRLNVFHIEIPPLRERKQDIPLLVKEFVRQAQSDPLVFTPETMQCLSEFRWDGNVRELKNVVQCILLGHKNDVVKINDLPLEVNEPMETKSVVDTDSTLEEVEKRHIIKVFDEKGKKIRSAAKALRIDKNTLIRKLKKYGIHSD